MTLKELWHPSLRKPLVVGIFLMVFQQMSGVNAIMFYAAKIFKEAGIDKPLMVSDIFGLTQFVATAVACLIVDRSGRRILLLVGAFGMCLCQVCLGVYYDIKKSPTNTTSEKAVAFQSVDSLYHSVPVEHITGLAIASALVFIAFFSIGWGPLPWLLMSEIFPPRAKGLASSICTLINWFFVFLVTKLFPQMIDALTEQGTFWFFGGCCLLSFIFVYFLVPETRGKTLEDIEHYFSEGHFPTETVPK